MTKCILMACSDPLTSLQWVHVMILPSPLKTEAETDASRVRTNRRSLNRCWVRCLFCGENNKILIVAAKVFHGIFSPG